MDRLRKLWHGEQAYQPLDDSVVSVSADGEQAVSKTAFSWSEYGVFCLLGIAMLWAWNMFLAAGPYFQHRFRDSQAISDNFQAAEISVSTVTNLGSMLILTKLQSNANYPKRIMVALLINTVVFSLLLAFTLFSASAEVYFAFLILMVFTTSFATGLIQNGIFAYVSGFGIPQYTQGIMTGQAVAGVLPCIAQIMSIQLVQPRKQDNLPGPPPVSKTSAAAYFLTAALISVITLVAFTALVLQRRQPTQTVSHTNHEANEVSVVKPSVPLSLLARKLFWLAGGVALTFAITMIFPVFTQRIVSVRPPNEQPSLLQPTSFIPLAFLFWNLGDLLGRLLTAFPSLSLASKPRIIFLLAATRLAWVGLYHLCNIRGRGALVNSDFFYLVIVQVTFGLTNGYLGSTCMIGAAEWVEPEEREAAGGFMSLCLVAGLTIGSIASFAIPGR